MRHLALSFDLVAAAGVRRAVRRFAGGHDEQALATALDVVVPGLASDPFGALDARAAARLVRERWQGISNRRDVYAALFEGRPQRTRMPFDVKGVTQEVLTWIDNLIEERDPDDKPRGRMTGAEAAEAYGVSRATAYRMLDADDPEAVLAIWGRAIRRRTVRQLVARGRTLGAARRLLVRRPDLIGDASAAAPPRHRQLVRTE